MLRKKHIAYNSTHINRNDPKEVLQEKIAAAANLEPGELLDYSVANSRLSKISEHVFQSFTLPASVATNFKVNGKELLIPMCIEEPSVVAAASHGAKIILKSGGFRATSSPAIVKGQIQLLKKESIKNASQVIDTLKQYHKTLKHTVENKVEKLQRLISRGGGFTDDVDIRILDDSMIVFEFKLDVQEAMGANLVNIAAEALAEEIGKIIPWQPHFRILSNDMSDRLYSAQVEIEPDHLTTRCFKGPDIARAIVLGSQFSKMDEFRAITHNKGVMNSVVAMGIATGQDSRAMEAAVHFYARNLGWNSQTGKAQYGPISSWTLNSKGNLVGSIQIPLPIGTKGRMQTNHTAVVKNMKILGNPTSAQLGEVMACAGLSSNLAALMALGTVGINQGHLKLHSRL